MHCMQSIPELCSRIACIVGFLMHTMHTSRMGWRSAITAERGGDPNPDKRAMRPDGVRECPKTRAVEDECLKSRTVEDRRTDNKEEVEEESSLFSTLYVFVFTCMHFVCSLYASLSAYIFSPSALRTRLFAFLYALYAVFFGVVSSHSMHSRFFDAYNAYRLHGLAVCRNRRTWRRP